MSKVNDNYFKTKLLKKSLTGNLEIQISYKLYMIFFLFLSFTEIIESQRILVLFDLVES